MVPEKFGTKLRVRRAGNRYRFSGTGLRRRFLVCVSLALNAYGGRSYYFRLEMRDFRRKMQKKLHNFNQRADNQLPIRAGQDRMLAGQCVGNIMLQRNRTSLCFILKMCCPVRRASHYDTQVALLSQRGRALFRVCQ